MSKITILFWGVIAYGLLIAVFSIPAALIDGFVVLHLYNWFALTSFHSLPPLTLAKAIGLSLLAGFMTTRFIYNYHPDEDDFKFLASALSFSYVMPWFLLLMGYIVHLYIT